MSDNLKCCYKGCYCSYPNSPTGAMDRTMHEALEWHCSGCGFSDGREHLDWESTRHCDLCVAQQRPLTPPLPSKGCKVIGIDFLNKKKVWVHDTRKDLQWQIIK